MKSIAVYIAAALSEIAGCFAFWAWLRLERSPVWLIPGVVSLALFGLLLDETDVYLDYGQHAFEYRTRVQINFQTGQSDWSWAR